MELVKFTFMYACSNEERKYQMKVEGLIPTNLDVFHTPTIHSQDSTLKCFQRYLERDDVSQRIIETNTKLLTHPEDKGLKSKIRTFAVGHNMHVQRIAETEADF